MTLRRYLLVRTAWAAGVVFAFVSIAYVVVWVVGDYRRDPGYGGFLRGVLRGDLGQTSFPGPGKRVSVNSVVWPASKVTLSLLLVTAVFTLVLAVLLALLARRGRVALASVRGFEFLGVSLLPIWTALLIGVYLFGKGHLLHAGGYCPLGSARAGQCHGPVEWAAHLVWPALTLAVFYAAVYSRMLRHDLRQAERERRARVADGEAAELVRRDVRRYYGAVYAKRAGRDLGFGLGFAFFAEVAFGLPGLGTTVYVARFGDPALMAGVLVWATVLGAAAGLLADALVAVLDPRFRRF